MRRPVVIDDEEAVLLDALSVEAALSVKQSLQSASPVRRF